MSFTRRQLGDRRWGLATEFPLKDGTGVAVLYERRSGDERRKGTISADDVRKLLSEFPAIESELLRLLSEKGFNT